MAHKCKCCNGVGWITCTRCRGEKKLNNGKDICYWCNGTGLEECPACKGRCVCED